MVPEICMKEEPAVKLTPVIRDWLEALVILACMALVVWLPHPGDAREPHVAPQHITAHFPGR